MAVIRRLLAGQVGRTNAIEHCERLQDGIARARANSDVQLVLLDAEVCGATYVDKEVVVDGNIVNPTPQTGTVINTGEIRIAEILAAVDETMDALSRGAGASGAATGTREQALADKLWEQLSANGYDMLTQTRPGDVVKNQLAPCPAVPAFIDVVDEVDAKV